MSSLEEPVFLSLDEILEIHEQQIERYGGAAVLWESLLQKHPFETENKRVAVTVTAAFLRVNGFRLAFDDREAFAFLVGLHESGRLRFAELESVVTRASNGSGGRPRSFRRGLFETTLYGIRHCDPAATFLAVTAHLLNNAEGASQSSGG
jgi:hypothetical protein